jgi:hypothetical protein
LGTLGAGAFVAGTAVFAGVAGTTFVLTDFAATFATVLVLLVATDAFLFLLAAD